MLMPTSNGRASCGVCGADIEVVANSDNAATEGPTDPQQRQEWLIEQINSIGSKFNTYGFNLNQLYQGKELTMALQGNAVTQLLIRKGVITKEEMDVYFFELMLEKFKEHERVILPQLREHAIKANAMPHGEPPNGAASIDEQIKKFLGPDGRPLF
jgi:hypothetical protein